MASFKREVKNVAAAATAAFTRTSVTNADILIGISIANTDASATATVDVFIDNYDAASGGAVVSTTHLAKNLKIPAGSSVEVLSGKVVLLGNATDKYDQLSVKSTGAASDVCVSRLSDAAA